MASTACEKVYIGVGSNLGKRQGNIVSAVELIGRVTDTVVTKASPLYETEPVGGPPQGKYLNGVIEVLTPLPPKALLDSLLEIERGLGRVRDGRNHPRTIDLDILLYGDIIVADNELIIPHPRMDQREFVTKPLGLIRS
jgi:2-amino-4-hydroxy-6-hydroxymethyldihydropteridine diphosphokinase